MPIVRNTVDQTKFNPAPIFPFELRLRDFEMAMQDVYDFFYDVDTTTEPARDRSPMTFHEIYLGHVTRADFRKNPRGELGTRTATLHREGIEKLRQGWAYRLSE